MLSTYVISMSSILCCLHDDVHVYVFKVATWAGNIMMARNHPEFPSDLVTIFEGAGVAFVVGQ